jgi:hypothetical protein
MAMTGSERLNADQHRALRLLANIPRGVTEEAFVFAHGFTREMLAGLVLAGLATAVTETVRAGGPTIKIERIVITDEGRRALEV